MGIRQHVAAAVAGRRARRTVTGAPFALPDLAAPRKVDATALIGVLVYQGVTTAEIDEPVHMLARGMEADVVHIAPVLEPVVGVEPVRTVHVDVIIDDPTAMTCDVLVIPGGLGWERVAHDLTIMTWLAHATTYAGGVLAISTGSLILASAGKLDGHQATGHWLARDTLSKLGADVQTGRTAQSADHRTVTASGAQSAIAAAHDLAQRVRWGPV